MTKSARRPVAVRVARGAFWWAPRLALFTFSSMLFVSMGGYGCGSDDSEFCNYEVEPVLLSGLPFACAPTPQAEGTPQVPTTECVDAGVDLTCGSQECNPETNSCVLTQCFCVSDVCNFVSGGLGYNLEGCPTFTPRPSNTPLRAATPTP